MLDAKDLKAIQSIMESVVNEQLDSRISQSESTILSEVDKRLDSRISQSETTILSEVDQRLDSRISQSETTILSEVDQRLDSRITKSERMMTVRLNKAIAKSENLLLGEMERTRRILEDKVETVQNNLNKVTEYYRITKLEHDNTALLLDAISNLEGRVANLEQAAL